ncbi:salivary C-type lectin 2-like [Rhynchophorus ferrugineus]|uniref:salivary C-type lectin 2-like n=1 Tax=Rhynchophorus ferrugineus TaxID=354439 RepID=UPI003FCDFEDF
MIKTEVNFMLFVCISFFIISTSANKYVVSNQRVTFYEAHSRCRQYGLDPAEILSENDEKEIEQALLPIKDLGIFDGFWIFASNLADKKNYYWLNSNLPLFYSAFYPGQPDNTGDKEHCLELYQSTTGVFAWNDLSCDTKKRFICQRKQKINACDDNRSGVL